MRAVVTLSFVLFFLNTSANTFYINPKGSDVYGNGSVSSPWQSLFKATSSVTKSGDIIHVATGVYKEFNQCSLAAGVSIEGEGTGSVITSNLTEDWKEFLSVRSTEGTDGNQHISNLKFDGQNLSTFWGIWVGGRSNVSIHDITMIDFRDRGIIFTGTNAITDGEPGVYAKNNSFYNNTVVNCAQYLDGYGRGCLNIGGQEEMLIYKNTIIQNSRPAGHNGWPVKLAAGGYIRGVKIYNNILTKNKYLGSFPGDNDWDFAIELWNISGGTEIHGNTIEGAIDLVNISRGKYDYGVWFHDNKILQPSLNKFFQSGLIFELSAEAVIVEHNTFDKISGAILFNAQENTHLENIVIRKNVFTDIGINTGNGNYGSAININCGTLLGNNLHYTFHDFYILDNQINSAANNSPNYGIQVTGLRNGNNIQIIGNKIANFRVAAIVANPASVIDSFLIRKNTFTNNGNNNDPLFIIGSPASYSFEDNDKVYLLNAGRPPYNYREQLIRPIYYETLQINIIEMLAFLAGIIGLWLYKLENIYAYPLSLLQIMICIFINLDKNLYGEIFLNFYFTAMLFWGWRLWLKRDNRNHRILRITSINLKESLVSAAYFAGMFLIILFITSCFKKYFSPNIFVIKDALANAAAFTAVWLLTKKKVLAWFYWIGSFILFSYSFFHKHYLVIGCYTILLLIIAIWGWYTWQKRSYKKGRTFNRQG